MLNAAQRQAVSYLDGPCLVIAGAGSGKTRVITQKILRLIEAGQTPSSIAAITFTNKAALEMQERLAAMSNHAVKADGKKQAGPLVCTFHSLGVRILRNDGKRLNMKPQFSILDSDDTQSIMTTALATTDRKLARLALSQVSLWKNALIDPEKANQIAAKEQERQFARAFREYQATLDAYQAVDFDDLIRLPTKLFEQHPEALDQWREKLRYFLVDEYQDTNTCQYELLKMLVGPRQAFTAVGDDDQSIYGWRGATLENLQKLGVDFPKLKVIKLEQNYRSCQSILTAANQLIGSNPKLHPKTLWSELGPGEPLQVYACEDDQAEAEKVVQKIQAIKFEKRSEYQDFAVLYRGNYQAKVFEQVLRKERIPYVLSGGQSFFERAEIRDLLAYLRLIVNPDDDPAFIRAITTPKRGIGNQSLQALGQYAAERQCSMFEALFEAGLEPRLSTKLVANMRTFGDFINRISFRAQKEAAGPLLDELLKAIEYEAHLRDGSDDKTATTKWQNVLDFMDWIKKRAEGDQGESTLLALAQEISLLTQLDRKDSQQDAVQLSTIHAAKGLEYPHVFIAGCEEGVLPFNREMGLDSDDDERESSAEQKAKLTKGASQATGASQDKRIEEERRLMYVAVTRAQRSLYLSWCQKRKRGRDWFAAKPSRFIGEMQLSASTQSNKPLQQDAAKVKLDALKAMLAQRSQTKTDHSS